MICKGNKNKAHKKYKIVLRTALQLKLSKLLINNNKLPKRCKIVYTKNQPYKRNKWRRCRKLKKMH